MDGLLVDVICSEERIQGMAVATAADALGETLWQWLLLRSLCEELACAYPKVAMRALLVLLDHRACFCRLPGRISQVIEHITARLGCSRPVHLLRMAGPLCIDAGLSERLSRDLGFEAALCEAFGEPSLASLLADNPVLSVPPLVVTGFRDIANVAPQRADVAYACILRCADDLTTLRSAWTLSPDGVGFGQHADLFPSHFPVLGPVYFDCVELVTLVKAAFNCTVFDPLKALSWSDLVQGCARPRHF